MRHLVFLYMMFGLLLACSADKSATSSDGSVNVISDGNNQISDSANSNDGSLIPDLDECAAISESAENNYQPVDVIFAIDNSKSMGDEIVEVQKNMNRFSQMVADQNLNMRIIMISCLPEQCDHDNSFGICIDAPVGAQGGCALTPADDNNLPDYLHINDRLPSQKGLEWIVAHYDDYKSALRDEAVRHIVVISDDTEEWSATQFETELLKVDPKFSGYYFHSIYSFMSKEDACAIGSQEPCCTYAAPAGEGTVYRELVTKTGGVGADLCLQDFDPVFDALGAKVITSAKLSCEWTIPPVPNGETLDPNKVNVVFTDGNNDSHLIGRVQGAEDCVNVTNGWYYDVAVNPTKVIVCPQTCTWIQGDPAASMAIEFGCETEIARIR